MPLLEVCPNIVPDDWFGDVVQDQILISVFDFVEVETNGYLGELSYLSEVTHCNSSLEARYGLYRRNSQLEQELRLEWGASKVGIPTDNVCRTNR
jgi:hypothetical protein